MVFGGGAAPCCLSWLDGTGNASGNSLTSRGIIRALM